MRPAADIPDVAGVDAGALPDFVLESTKPLVLRGIAANWPLVRAGLQSPAAAVDYLLTLYRQATVGAFLAGADEGGRYFYNADLDGFNFKAVKIKLDTVLQQILHYASDPRPPSLYVGSTTIDTALPDFRQTNDFGFGGRDPLASIWIGNRTRIAAHQDLPDNLACVAVGRRRFTLFPPQQLENLYIGPLDFTPAGQAISLVDFANPDLEKFPRFVEAMRHSVGAELGPGDAIFIPSMWWHHIESLEPLNVLVNYWWRRSPAFMDTPFIALMLAMMTVRDLPPEQLEAWRGMFEHYVFDATPDKAAHIPADARRMLLPFDADRARELRLHLLQRLNR
jgi:hypothetical protein